ncbi:MAG: hypothetical protein AAFV53_34065 [Myxococcota bacterium]
MFEELPKGPPIPTLPYQPGMFGGLQHGQVRLPEYPTPYSLIQMKPDATIARRLQQHALIRIAVPDDLRQVEPLFSPVHTKVTRTMHSQSPHIDFPHLDRDPRRYNLFWAEAPRTGAATYFIPLTHAAQAERLLQDFLCGNAEVWAMAEPIFAAHRNDPASLSRYPLPQLAVDAFTVLTRDGDDTLWRQLSGFGQTTVSARVLGNTVAGTRCVSHILANLNGIAYLETWRRPYVILFDDTRFYHGRIGVGDSGGDFYRVWVTGEPIGGLSYFDPTRSVAAA